MNDTEAARRIGIRAACEAKARAAGVPQDRIGRMILVTTAQGGFLMPGYDDQGDER